MLDSKRNLSKQMDEENQVASAESEAETVTEDTETSNDESAEEQTEALRNRLAQVEKARDDLAARAKKAEEKLKKLAPHTEEKKDITSSLNEQQIQEVVLRSQGFSSELLDHLKVVAKMRGKSLIEAQDDPIFKSIKSEIEAEKKKEQANLPPSKGSAARKEAKTFNSSGLSKDQHKELWKSQFK